MCHNRVNNRPWQRSDASFFSRNSPSKVLSAFIDKTRGVGLCLTTKSTHIPHINLHPKQCFWQACRWNTVVLRPPPSLTVEGIEGAFGRASSRPVLRHSSKARRFGRHRALSPYQMVLSVNTRALVPSLCVPDMVLPTSARMKPLGEWSNVKARVQDTDSTTTNIQNLFVINLSHILFYVMM